jgi:glycine/D-amino acid oxidase-like deaminating enzyme
MRSDDHADLVIVGAGAIGGWAAYFAATDGLGRVVVLERGVAGQGASSRAAGMVRAQGGTPTTVELGRFSIDFYRRQASLFGVDSGFRELGYLIMAVTDEDVRSGRERVAMQQATGLAVRWIEPAEIPALTGTMVADGHQGGSFLATDGSIDPPRNVLAYTAAMRHAGVELRERTPVTGFRIETSRGGVRPVTGVETASGTIVTDRVLLTGGPTLRPLGELAGVRIPVGAVRHTVAVTEPHEAFERPQPMVFDIGAGLYWRLEDGGLLFGFSDPDDPPGIARSIDWTFVDRMRARLAAFVPVTDGLAIRKIWAATIEYTPDHLPILGSALASDGRPIDGLWVASAGGHGMMWGPGVARVAADLVQHGSTDRIDASDLGLERFDAQGRSRLATDPIALPFPTDTGTAPVGPAR